MTGQSGWSGAAKDLDKHKRLASIPLGTIGNCNRDRTGSSNTGICWYKTLEFHGHKEHIACKSENIPGNSTCNVFSNRETMSWTLDLTSLSCARICCLAFSSWSSPSLWYQTVWKKVKPFFCVLPILYVIFLPIFHLLRCTSCVHHASFSLLWHLYILWFLSFDFQERLKEVKINSNMNGRYPFEILHSLEYDKLQSREALIFSLVVPLSADYLEWAKPLLREVAISYNVQGLRVHANLLQTYTCSKWSDPIRWSVPCDK